MNKNLFLAFLVTVLMVLSAQAQRVRTIQPDTIPAQMVSQDDCEPLPNEELSFGLPAADATMQTDSSFLVSAVCGGRHIDNVLSDSRHGRESAEWDRLLRCRLDALLNDPLFETTQLGLMVWDLTADSCVYKHNERQRMRPASIMKNLTSVTAIDVLGLDYQFKTSLYYKGMIIDSLRTLAGDIYCVGGMDPKFGSKDMSAFVQAIKSLGIDTIRGSISFDDSFKDKDRLGYGWCWDDDNPVLTPLLCDKKDEFSLRFLSELRRAGIIMIGGGVQNSTVPIGSSKLICERRHSIKEIITQTLKESDNLFAESLFYNIAAATSNKGISKGASSKQARTAVRQVLAKAGVNTSEDDIADGSGLSLYNYVTPNLEVQLLRYAWRHKDIYAFLSTALPVAGVDGTLKSRMKNTAAWKKIFAKTGTVTGVSSLAGYAQAANGHVLCFCIINQGISKTSDGRRFQDKVCAAMCQ